MHDLKAAAKRKKKAKRKGPIEDLMESLRQRIRELNAEIAVRDNMGNEVLRILREATGKRDFHSEMEAAEYAAEIIRESGWRAIAEAPGNEWATYGKWVLRRVAFVWEEFHTTNKELAIDSGFTHYLLKPEPPAREMFNDGE